VLCGMFVCNGEYGELFEYKGVDGMFGIDSEFWDVNGKFCVRE